MLVAAAAAAAVITGVVVVGAVEIAVSVDVGTVTVVVSSSIVNGRWYITTVTILSTTRATTDVKK